MHDHTPRGGSNRSKRLEGSAAYMYIDHMNDQTVESKTVVANRMKLMLKQSHSVRGT